MKKIIFFIALVAGLCSCKKVLETKPTDFLAPETYFTNETQIQSALTGVYDCLQKGGMFSGADGLPSQFNIADEFFYAASSSNFPRIYKYDSSDALTQNIWAACYTGIQRANVVIANIDKPVMDNAHRSVVKGEAKFLRAFFYFVLVENFGGVPLRKVPTPSVVDVNISRTPANEVYDFIISEMTEAEALVPPMTAYTYNERITQQTVDGILARVCLFKAGFPNNDISKYAEAAKWAKKVMDAGLNQLNPNVNQVFINMTQNLYDTKESMWEVGYYTTGTGDAYTEYGPGLGVLLGVTQPNQSYGLVNSAYRIQQHLYDMYEKDPNIVDPNIAEKALDLRRDIFIAPFRYTNTATTAPIKTYWPATNTYDRQCLKFDRTYELTTNKFQSNTPQNYSMLRYSDVLLMFAEADNEANTGPSQADIDAVNMVRRRGYGKLMNGEGVKLITIGNAGAGYTTAPTVTINGGGGSGATATATVAGGKITSIVLSNHGTSYTSVPTITFSGGGGTGATATATLSLPTDADLKPAQYADKASFRKTIQDERARELCFEGWRRLDLIRWNILVPTLQQVTIEANASSQTTYKQYAIIPGNNVSTINNYLPIPLQEMTLNKAMTQNPGW